MSKKSILIILIVLGVIGISNAGSLLVNGDFEDNPSTGWSVWWGGNTNLHIGDPDPAEDDFVGALWWSDDGIFQTVPIGPGTYEVGGKVYFTSDIPIGQNRWLYISAELMDDVDNILDSYDIILDDTAPLDTWNSVNVVVDNTTTGAVQLNVNMFFVDQDGPQTGTGIAYFDDIYAGPLGVSDQAKFPIPEDGALGVPPITDTLRWQNPDPNNPADSTTSDVFLCEGNDPNLLVLVANDITTESVGVTLLSDTQYLWRVDCTDPHGDPNTGDPVQTQGEVWTFTTSNDNPPVVDAGPDKYLVATASPMDVGLNASVDDEGTPTITWTDLTNPEDKDPDTTVTINDPNAAITTVTLENLNSGVVTGYYIFEITVDDGFNPAVTDEMIINVLGTCREAAEADPNDDWNSTGDIDGNCKVDLGDVALMAANWLGCNTNRAPGDVTCP